MPRNPERNHLKAWREHRGMTQARLAEAIGTTGAVISLLESGDRRVSHKWLLRIAPALNTRPAQLLEFDPSEAANDTVEILPPDPPAGGFYR
jgi:transcriptional regulator with XRE-family HTH domain